MSQDGIFYHLGVQISAGVVRIILRPKKKLQINFQTSFS